MHKPHVSSGGRYPVLRALAIIYVIGAAIAVIGTLLGIAYAIFGFGYAWTDRLILAVGALTAGFFMVVSALAVAEVLKLFIDVEHNTRMSAAGRIGMPAMMTPQVPVSGDAGVVTTHINRLDALDEETAEAALLRGH